MCRLAVFTPALFALPSRRGLILVPFETGGVGNPSFKVRAKIFAMRHQVDERASLWCKAPPGAQEVLIHTHPERFFVPPYVGHHGWIGVWLENTLDWEELADLIRESYIMTAPKRLHALLDEP